MSILRRSRKIKPDTPANRLEAISSGMFKGEYVFGGLKFGVSFFCGSFFFSRMVVASAGRGAP
jgi:hypothetical protein